MTLDELKAKVGKLFTVIEYACEICDAPDHRNESRAVVVPLIMRRALAESELELLLAGLTTEERMFLRDEIYRKIREWHELSIAEPGKKDEAARQIHRLRERLDRISKYGGIVATEINGRDLLDEVARKIQKFVAVTKDQARLLTLWIVHTHVMRHGVFYYTPRLLTWSKEPDCGKSTLRKVLSQLVHNPISSVGITGSDLLALLKEHNPPVFAGNWKSVGGSDGKGLTLLIDEGDNIMQTQKLRRIFNGNSWSDTIKEKNRSTALMEDISTFAPSALFEIDDAERKSPSMRSYAPFKSRSVELELRQAQQDAEHDADPGDDLYNSLSMELRPSMEAWVGSRVDDIGETYQRLKKEMKKEELSKVIRNRARDNWLPLIAIADVAGGHWPETVRELCLKFAPHRRTPTERVEQAEGQVRAAEQAPAAKPELEFAANGGKVAVAKMRIMRALRESSPRSRYELRLAGCKNIPGPDFDRALQELLAEGMIVPKGKASSGGKPKDMYGVAYEH